MLGIEAGAEFDPRISSGFSTQVTIVDDWRFTGTMTPLVMSAPVSTLLVVLALTTMPLRSLRCRPVAS